LRVIDRGSSLATACRWGGLAATLALLLAACGGHATIHSLPVRQASSASCAGFGASAQFANARLVLIGTMLAGPSVALGRRDMLASPARVRVQQYLKGRGPKFVTVTTAVAPHGDSIQVSEDGIEPVARERWRIYTNSKRSPYQTSICGGSKRIGPSSPRPAEPARR
jgi:hypothetical protein